MKVINLFGGPGTGKSTTAADLFALMKWNNERVELINEYAKAVVWERHFNKLDDQLYILAKQNRMLERLRDQVDYTITDSPILLSKIYGKDYKLKSFPSLVDELFNSYDNINIFLKRVKPYHKMGRTQDEQQARIVDESILKSLEGLHYYEVVADSDAKNKIYNIICNK